MKIFALFLAFAVSDLIASNGQKGYYYDIVAKTIKTQELVPNKAGK